MEQVASYDGIAEEADRASTYNFVRNKICDSNQEDLAHNPVNIRMPDAILRRRAVTKSGSMFSEQFPMPREHANKPCLRRRTTGLSGNAFHLDSLWADLYFANELEAEVEDSATRTLRSASRAVRVLDRSMSNLNPRASKLTNISTANSVLDEVKKLHVPLNPSHHFVTMWDCAGLALVAYDAVAIPTVIAFDIDMPVAVTFLICAFWVLDVVLKFNTGYFAADGSLIMDRRCVTRRYGFTWLPFDLLVIVADITVAFTADGRSSLRALRGVRMIKLLRLLRLLKARRIAGSFEDLMAEIGVQKTILIWSILETLSFVFFSLHFLACTWYFIGVQEKDAGQSNWIDIFASQGIDDPAEYYTHALYWILGHLIAAPVDPTIQPRSLLERSFTVSIVFSSLLVLGVAISKMTNTIAELNRARAEASDTKRKLRRILRTTGLRRDSVSRTVRFAMHSWHRKNDLVADSSILGLLSKKMATEIIVKQRGSLVVAHPFLNLMNEVHPEVFLSLCSAFQTVLYADREIVFSMETLSECFYCTLKGGYTYKVPCGMGVGDIKARMQGQSLPGASKSSRSSDEDEVRVMHFDTPKFLCEMSLYCRVVHQTELSTRTFADALTLTASDLAQCVKISPKCVGLVYRYAKAFLTLCTQDMDINIECVPLTNVQDLCEDLTTQVTSGEADLNSPAPDRERVMAFVQASWETAKGEDAMWSSEDRDALEQDLVCVFGELDPDDGIYKKLGMTDERWRAIASLRSFMFLMWNDYAGFVASQPDSKRVSLKAWEELRQYIEWTGLSCDEMHAMLVFLVIRGLGKVTSFLKAMADDDRHPEAVVQRLLRCMDRQVPCKLMLTAEQIDLIDNANRVHKVFNLAQFLQGENTPYQVLHMQQLARVYGDRVFKFSLLAFVAHMSGLRGAESVQGSKFLDAQQVSSLLTGLHVLRRWGEANHIAIYWSYITTRARKLGLAIEDENDLALARLACLSRTSDDTLDELRNSWKQLAWHDRQALKRHFLADGDAEAAFVFTFLPLYLKNARVNRVVGLRRAFLLLIDILDMLDAGAYASKLGLPTITVSLEDLCSFTKEVAKPSTFMAATEHACLVQRGHALTLLISTKHKQSANDPSWADDPGREVKTTLRHLSRTMGAVAYALDGNASRTRVRHPPPPVAPAKPDSGPRLRQQQPPAVFGAAAARASMEFEDTEWLTSSPRVECPGSPRIPGRG